MNDLPTIALSARWHAHRERFDWIAANGFAVEYTPNPHELELLPVHVDPLLKLGVPVRYHAFLPGYEIAHQESGPAARALRAHLRTLEAIDGRGEGVVTVHIGLRREDPVHPERATENLSRLVQRGQDLGITICLENLRRGPTSEPEAVVAWAEASGAMLTLDVGHMLGCHQVEMGALAVPDFIEMFAGRLTEVHIYERETDRHYPPQDMTILGPIIDRLRATRCTWWTIELDDQAEALATRTLLLDFLGANR